MKYSERLKPCPFCEGKGEIYQAPTMLNLKIDDDVYWVQCRNCFGRTGNSYSKIEAINAWNRRTDKLIRRMRIDMDRMKYQYNLDVIKGMSLAIGYIVGRPTAYDMDKVIEHIEFIKENGVCAREDCGHCKYFKTCWDGEMSDRLALDKAIEIVKRGGRDEE